MAPPAGVRRRLTVLSSHAAGAAAGSPPSRELAADSPSRELQGLTEAERYWFDTAGWVVILSVLSSQQVAACNAALEQNRGRVQYTPLSEDYADAPRRPWVVPPSLAGSSARPGRSQLSAAMELPSPDRRVFREIFLHEKTLGCMRDLIGKSFRGAEGRILLTQRGAEGHALHSGGTTRDADEEASTLTLGGNMSLCHNGANLPVILTAVEIGLTSLGCDCDRAGVLWNTVMSCQYALSDVPPGAGGFCCISGSHKANFECPWPVRNCQNSAEMLDRRQLTQPVMAAGDCLLFTESLTHGTLPWTAEHERRTLFYRYMSRERGGLEIPAPGAERDAFIAAASD